MKTQFRIAGIIICLMSYNFGQTLTMTASVSRASCRH